MLQTRKYLKLLFSCYFVSLTAIAEVPGPPEIGVMDDTGINILTGLPSFNQTDIEIGSGVSKLTHTISSYDAGYFWNFQSNLTPGAGFHFGSFQRFGRVPGGSPQRFNPSGGGYVPENRNGATLVQQQDGGWVYTAADGTIVTNTGGIFKTTYPNGFEIRVYSGDEIARPGDGVLSSRKVSFVTNTGLQLLYGYEGNDFTNKKFYLPSSIKAINNAYEYCVPTSSICNLAQSWPTSTYDWPEYDVVFATYAQGAATAQAVFKVTDAKGQVTSYVHRRLPKNGPNNLNMTFAEFRDLDGNPAYVSRLTEIYNGPVSGEPIKQYTYENFVQAFPAEGHNNIRYELKLQLVKEASIGDAVWTYKHTQPDTPYRSSGLSKGPRGNIGVVMAFDGAVQRYFSIYRPGAGAFYEDNQTNRVKEAYEFGIQYLYDYDARGNITQRTQVGKNGKADIILTAGYDTSCSNLKTCNKPNWIRDAKGNQTDYQYHAQSGQLLKVTGPADINGVRPQTRYTYTQKYAWYKNSSGSYAQAASPVWMLTREAYCKSSAATATGCSAAGDEVVTTYDYGPNSGPNNLFLRGTTVTADGKSQTSCYDYDRFGNIIAETKPRANVVSCY